MDAQKDRLELLERQVKFLRTALIGLLLMGIVGLLLGATTGSTATLSKIILPRASGGAYSHCLTFEAEGGQKLAELQLRDHGPALWLYDNTGRLVLNLGACANNYGGYVETSGKPSEGQISRLCGRGFYLMGRPATEEGATTPWISLDRAPNISSGLEIHGDGPGQIRLDVLPATPRVEVLGADGTQAWCTP